MTDFSAVAALLPTRGFRLGPMRLTPYGACAALGVLSAMGLTGRTARRLGLSPEAAWDTGLFAILSCFAASRLLLVLADPKAFVHYPLLVLGLPSLTIGGMALAALVTWIYVRRKRLPLARTLDAFAPGGALLAAFLELGHFLDGSEPGMPVFRNGGDHAVGLRPVSLFGLVVAMLLLGLLWLASGRRWRRGRVAALGLMLGGLSAFTLDMISLPAELFSTWWLDPGQLVALGAMVAGALLWTFGTDDPELIEGLDRHTTVDLSATQNELQGEER